MIIDLVIIKVIMKFIILLLGLSSPSVAQEVLPSTEPPVVESESQQPLSTPVGRRFEQPPVELERAPDRIVLFIDTLKYQHDTLELASKSEQRQKNLSRTSEFSSFVSTSTTIGIKSYHNGLILGFGLSSDLNANSESANGGALFIGYELDASWQFGGLLFIDNKEEHHEAKRQLQVDDQIIHVTEINETSISQYSLGLWSKYALNNYWRGQLSAYYATSERHQMVDNGQQTQKKTEIERRYLALTATLGAYVQISQRLTFAPQINITYALPLSYVQIIQTDTSSTAPAVKEKLDFDEQHSFSYSLTLAGFRYQL